MKTIVFGDIHGRNIWKNILDNESNFDLVVFLGDYVTSRENISEEEQIKNYKEILEFKAANPDRVILLRGNHDMQALGYSWAGCYPRFNNTYFSNNKDEFLNNTQWLAELPNNIILSHAGITKTWLDTVFNKFNINNISEINNIPPCEYFGFLPDNIYDSTGDSKTQSLVWVRPYALSEDGLEDKIFIIGHTRYESVDMMTTQHGIKPKAIYLADKLPDKYIVIEDDKIELRNSKR